MYTYPNVRNQSTSGFGKDDRRAAVWPPHRGTWLGGFDTATANKASAKQNTIKQVVEYIYIYIYVCVCAVYLIPGYCLQECLLFRPQISMVP